TDRKYAGGSADAAVVFSRGVRPDQPAVAGRRLDAKILVWVLMARAAGGPTAGGLDPYPGGHLSRSTGRDRRDRGGPRRVAGFLREPLRNPQARQSHWYRHRNPTPESSGHRTTCVGPAHQPA